MLATGSGASEHPNVAAGRGEESAAADSAAAGPLSPTINEKSGQQDSSASGLLGYVSNVFSSDGGAGAEKTETGSDRRNCNLLLTLRTLHGVWTLCGMELSPTDAKSLSLDAIKSKSGVRASRKTCDEHATQAMIEILDIVTPSAQILERAKKTAHAQNSNNATSMSDATLFSFFDAVLARMEPGEATQVCPVVIVFVKDFVANSLARKICLTAAIEDRRTKRDLQDNFVKLIDSCILISGRLFDQSTWNRRSGRDNGEELDKEAAEFAAELLSLEDKKLSVNADGNSANGVIDAINHFLATQVESSVLAVLSELVRMPGSVKAWRSTVADLFNDARFFSIRLNQAERFKPIMLALMSQDKERLMDLLARVSASAAAANFFANRELEMLSRALNLRRLSFTLFSSKQDGFLTQLPLIKEKLVDLLRSQVNEVLHAEVYLCLRVVLPEDFQINEWLFITDTIDAVYPSDDFQPETLLDGLSATFQKESSKHSHQHHHHQHENASEPGKIGKRRLQLGRMRTIGSVGELGPFLNSVSQNAFESNYGDQEVDLHDVDACLLVDMFDSGDTSVAVVEELASGGMNA
ncbi:related to DOP1 - strong similarity to developmental regulatory gene, dopey (dopA) [Ustilago sp. UG-2017b]|nr:related to DOP1 - strong similarity to developmental regulatory gene, dopey (dopA) [Ustilago sp. UG-2017b]